MRYFDDGDLTDGLQLTPKHFPVEHVEGDYHVVWTYCRGKRRTLDWSSQIDLANWELKFQKVPAQEGGDSRHFNVSLNFGSLELEYILDYQDKIVNRLDLVTNKAPGEGSVESEAMVTFSEVRDESGYPYLRFSFSTNEHNPDDDMVNIEFVAKRTDETGVHQLGLTKNEKLRLGYAVWDDGTFEPENSDEEVTGQSADSLNKQLQRHIEASVKIHAKLVTMRNNVDKQVANATNGMQQALNQAWRSASHPDTSLQTSFDTSGAGMSPPPARRKRGEAATTEDLEIPPLSQRRKKGSGPERTPISMEDEELLHSGARPVGYKRKRGEKAPGKNKGGRPPKRKSMRTSI
ncbi:MAG: hypothetical protein ALECFALPRED_009181 [Alectoria fallacina]|uniref:Uncharacterized protein n=1 Tax=Alectoria fallacina TaxID=1903189 RepID=A0A8H3PJ54_9LECA|nr:MAG: hypothetical protein ALECFALPRED_009181 [Alectoria fallacina]